MYLHYLLVHGPADRQSHEQGVTYFVTEYAILTVADMDGIVEKLRRFILIQWVHS
jgi:hypothetical protein